MLKNIFVDIGDEHYYLIQRFKCPVHITLSRTINVHTYFRVLSDDELEKYRERIRAVDHFANLRRLEGYYYFVDDTEIRKGK